MWLSAVLIPCAYVTPEIILYLSWVNQIAIWECAGWAHGLLRDILTGIIMSRGNWTSIQTYGQEAHCVDDMMKLSEAKQYHGHDQHSTPTIREPPLPSTGRLETAIFNRAGHTGLYIYGGRRTYLISVLSYTHWACPRPIVCSADQSWDCHHCRTRN